MLLTREFFQRYEATVRSTRPDFRMDSDTSIFVENQLKQVVAEVYNRVYPELEAKSLMPLRNNINPGAKSWAWMSYEQRGRAKFYGALANDPPRVDVAGKEIISPIRGMWAAWGYNIDDIESARMANAPLDTQLAEAARRAIAELQDTTLYFGDLALGIPGLFTDPRTAVVTVPNGNWLAGATGDQVVQDLNAVADTLWTNSNMTVRGDVMLLPMAQYRYAQEARMSNTTMNALQYFLANNGWVKDVRPNLAVATAGPGGVKAIFNYQRSPDILHGVEPLPFTPMPPQFDALETTIIARLKTGGCTWYRPMGGIMGIGI
jgi:hypothetical protein